MPLSTSPYPRPGFRDWALLGVSLAFVLCGLIILPHDLNVGLVTLAVFGPCAALAASIVLRKLRFRGQHALKAEIVGGVPIRMSRKLFLTYGGVLAGMGLVMVLFGRGYGLIFWLLAWFVLFVGCALLAGVLSGRLASRTLQFDPEGIRFGQRGFVFTVPWESIVEMRGGELQSNPALFIWLRDAGGITVDPADQAHRVVKLMAHNIGWIGAPLVLFPSQYGLDLPLLTAALGRYLSDPDERQDLARRLLPEG
jgi:hypothetical protein